MVLGGPELMTLQLVLHAEKGGNTGAALDRVLASLVPSLTNSADRCNCPGLWRVGVWG